MTPTQKQLVRQSFQKIIPIADTAAALFYARLFELDPKLKALFKGDMQAQGRKLIDMIATAVRNVENLAAVLPEVENLGRRHVAYGVTDAHYDTVAQALLDTLAKGLGADFTAETRAAWVELYQIIADAMKQAGRRQAYTAR